MKTFNTIYTGEVFGGPCPVCGSNGTLIEHFGTYGPEGIRTIVHMGHETEPRECALPITDGWLVIDHTGMWYYTRG